MNIKGLDKAEVLAVLYNNSFAMGMGMLNYVEGDLPIEEARIFINDAIVINSNLVYFDYLLGRIMKIDLTTDEVDTTKYNKDNGENAAENLIDKLR